MVARGTEAVPVEDPAWLEHGEGRAAGHDTSETFPPGPLTGHESQGTCSELGFGAMPPEGCTGQEWTGKQVHPQPSGVLSAFWVVRVGVRGAQGQDTPLQSQQSLTPGNSHSLAALHPMQNVPAPGNPKSIASGQAGQLSRATPGPQLWGRPGRGRTRARLRVCQRPREADIQCPWHRSPQPWPEFRDQRPK